MQNKYERAYHKVDYTNILKLYSFVFCYLPFLIFVSAVGCFYMYLKWSMNATNSSHIILFMCLQNMHLYLSMSLSYYLHVSHVWKKHLYLFLPRLHFYFISSKFTLFSSLVYQFFKTSLSFRTQLLTMTCFNPNLPLLASLCAFLFLSNPAHCSDTFLLSNTFYSLTFLKIFYLFWLLFQKH